MRLASAAPGGTTTIWSVKDGQTLHAMSHDQSAVHSLCLLGPDTVATGTEAGDIIYWSIMMGEGTSKLSVPDGSAVLGLCTLDSDKLASGTKSGNIVIWNLGTGECLQTMSTNDDPVRQLCAVGPDTLACGTSSGKIMIWDVRAGECVRTLSPSSGKPITALCAAGPSAVACCDGTGNATIWDVTTGNCIHTLSHESCAVHALCSLGERLAAGTDSGKIMIWDVSTGTQHCTLCPPTGSKVSSLCSLGKDPLGQDVLASISGSNILFWCVESGAPLGALPARDAGVLCCLGK